MTWAYPVDVLITVDHDAESALLQSATGLRRGPSFLSHGAFGAKVGLGRMLDVLAARAVPATFFVPGWVAERWPTNVEEILAGGHEVALHGYLHEYATGMVDVAEERMTLARATEALAGVSGATPVGFRPPGCLYSEWTVDLLREFGFVYGSSMQDDDGAYVHADPTGFSRPLVEVPCHWQLCDDLFGWDMDVRMTPSEVEEIWLSELDALGRYESRTYVLTLHPHQMGHPGRLTLLERVLDRAAELGARFRTCADVAHEVLDLPGDHSGRRD
jgi:peptidoglycan/xylan/chitin deacetylase (PgdA/CDA1 family)